MSKKLTYYKVLSKTGVAKISGAKWSLPYRRWGWGDYAPGVWHTVIGKLNPCSNGLHLASTPEQIRHWGTRNGSGFRVFFAEVEGPVIAKCPAQKNGKFVARTVRLVREINRGSQEWNEVVLGEAQTAQSKKKRP